MAKDLPVTLDGNVIYHIKLTDSSGAGRGVKTTWISG